MVKLRMHKCSIRTSSVSEDWVGGLGAEKLNLTLSLVK